MSPSFLFCRSAQCQAKPLSFDGVHLGQKWSEFLKGHPKVEVFLPSDEEEEMTKAQQLARASKRGEATLDETLENGSFSDAFYGFDHGSLTSATFGTSSRIGIKRNLVALKAPLRQLLIELGTPTAQGTIPTEFKDNAPLLVWETPTQTAIARIDWPSLPEESGFCGVAVSILDVPWRVTKPSWMIWPPILAPNKEDLVRTHQLMALLEGLHPGSTKHIEALKVAPGINWPSPKRK